MKLLKVSVLAASVALLGGCATAASPVGNGLLFTSVNGPLGATTSANNSKRGEACATNLLGLLASGDATIHSAKEAGGISTVSNVDHESTSILGLYSEFCTVVEGK